MRSLLPLQIQDNSPGSLFHQVPIEGGTPIGPELSEAECDIDTLKKLKLGMRSSLWSRPSASNSGSGGGGGGGLQLQLHQHPSQQSGGHPSDYSIAV